jgi:hypothetical protein
VLNGTKMKKVETGTLSLRGLNWLGVTTNFVAVTALSAALGAVCLAAGLGGGWWAWPAGGATALLLMLWLPLTHRRANHRCRELDDAWQHAPPPDELREQHARKSLDSTAADIAVVVVMAVALFAGVFNALTNLAAVADTLAIEPAPVTLKHTGPAVLSTFLLLSLLLSCRILVRLRLAFGEHSRTLAALRQEVDRTAMLWRPQERTYLLYAIVLLLAAAAALLLGYERIGPVAGIGATCAVLVAGGVWYPAVLAIARRRAVKARNLSAADSDSTNARLRYARRMPDDDRHRSDRSAWPVRVCRLGEEPAADETTASERLAMMWELVVQSWAMAGRTIPDYERRNTPVRVVPLAEADQE